MQRIGNENILIIFKAGFARKYSEFVQKLDNIPGVDIFVVDSVLVGLKITLTIRKFLFVFVFFIFYLTPLTEFPMIIMSFMER